MIFIREPPFDRRCPQTRADSGIADPEDGLSHSLKALYPGTAQDNEGYAGTEDNDPYRQHQCQQDTHPERDRTDPPRPAIPEHKTASLASPAVFRICWEAVFGAGKAVSVDVLLIKRTHFNQKSDGSVLGFSSVSTMLVRRQETPPASYQLVP